MEKTRAYREGGNLERRIDFFLAHAASDKARVESIRRWLKRNGWRVKWDADFRPGRSARAQIRNAIDVSQRVLVLWSESSVNSPWVICEAAWGDDRLIPMRLDRTVDPPEPFADDSYENLTTWRDDLPDKAELAALQRKLTNKVRPFVRGSALLPQPPKPLIGRSAEFQRFQRVLTGDTPRPVLVFGGPGVGKTSLCVSVLYDQSLIEMYGVNRYYIDLTGATDFDQVIARVTNGLELEISRDAREGIIDKLRDQPTLIMFENAQMARRNNRSRLQMDKFLEDIDDIPNSTFICAMRGLDIPHNLPWGERCQLHGLDVKSSKELFFSITGDAFRKTILISIH